MTHAFLVDIDSGATVNLADLDTQFLVPCKSCGELLEEHDQFCPRCGKDQTVGDATGDERSSLDPKRDVSVDDQAPALALSGLAAVQQQAQPQSSIGSPAASPNRLAIGTGVALVALLAIALTYRHFQTGKPSETGQRPALASVVEPAREPAAPLAQPSAHSLEKAPVAPASAPENGASKPAEGECGEVLAALALCTRR